MKKKTDRVFYILIVISVFCCVGFAISVSATDEYVEGAFTYTVTNGEATIVSVDESVFTVYPYEIEFPSKLGSYPVVAVEDDSYQQVNRIRGFIYPDSVKRINFPNFVVNNYELRRVVIYNKECLVRYSISDSYFCKDYDSIIWGYKGSTAEKFAEEYNKKFINIDSVNQDGIYDYCVNNNEATILLVPGDTSGEIEIPSQIQGFPVTEIDDAAFKRTDIIKVTIPGSVNRIGNQAFFCFDLKDISLSEGLKTIGDRAFCSNSIKNIELPESLETIGNQAFYYAKLNRVFIPKNVRSIGYGAFEYCSYLKNITVDPKNDYYSNDNRGVLFNKNKTLLVEYPKGNETSDEYQIPNTVEVIEEYAFAFVTRLNKILFPETVKRIEQFAFYCSGLTEISFSNGLETIGKRAFDSTYVQEIFIPETVTQLSYEAFHGCDKLKHFISYSPNVEIYSNSQTISNTAIIYGFQNSTAQAYAEKYNRNFVLLESADSYEELVEYVRQQMIDRRKYIILSYSQGVPELKNNNDFVGFFDAVFAHDKSNSAVGDNLRWSVKRINCAVQNEGYLVLDVDYSSTAEQESLLADKITGIVESLRLNDKPEYEKARLIFEYLCDKANAISPADKSYNDIHHSAYSVLVNNIGVCEGFSLAFYRLALEAGIDTRVVVSEKQLHACNIVKIADQWYYLDTYLAADEDDSSRGDVFYFLKSSVESQFIGEDYIDFTPDYETEEKWALTPKEIKGYSFSETDYIVDGGCSHILEFIGYAGQPCSGTGKEEYNCPKCGNEFSRNCSLEHSAVPGSIRCQWCNKNLCKHEEQYKVIVPEHKATCTEDGLTSYEYCSRCEEHYFSIPELIPATGHIDKDNDGVCDQCGTTVGKKENAFVAAIKKFFGKINTFLAKLFKWLRW